ncbi:hypothetical protein CJ255_21800 [Candidatus Viridilinea mediisalina]|uniref:eCIS core domain-containing protein n=1 Tax=Candidatus Viridilinea mediisalina TaxID=2024553 RepID=A0A2A6RCV3_9CHLR|nr:hypothetical protein CJ255_21800 [Candidatus Viridilinea mediisalina]
MLPLRETTRRFLAPIVGLDPATVPIYRGAEAAQLAAAYDAEALTVDGAVFLGPGYAEDTPESLGLLAHELTHVAENREQGAGSREQSAERREQSAERREQRTENREQGTENREQRTGNREQRTGNREQGTENREQGTENREQGTERSGW